MKLKTGIKKVVGPNLVVLPIEVEEKTASGIIINTNDQRNREQMSQVKGTVVDIGNLCWKDQYNTTPWCEIGDIILFSKFSGYVHKGNDGKEYRIISDLDVRAILETEN